MTMRTLSATALVSVLVVLMAAPSFAHHSFAAEFDGSKCRDFTGMLTKLEWANPHGFFYVDIKDARRQGEQLVVPDLRAHHAAARRERSGSCSSTTSARKCG